MKKLSLKMVALIAAMMMCLMVQGQALNDSLIPADAPTRSLSTDTTMWFNQTQALGEVVVKSRMPKTKIKAQVQVKPSRSA